MKMVVIDKEKLADVISAEIDEIRFGPYLAGEIVIGATDDVQVKVIVTKDRSDFDDEPSDNMLCIAL